MILYALIWSNNIIVIDILIVYLHKENCFSQKGHILSKKGSFTNSKFDVVAGCCFSLTVNKKYIT